MYILEGAKLRNLGGINDMFGNGIVGSVIFLGGQLESLGGGHLPPCAPPPLGLNPGSGISSNFVIMTHLQDLTLYVCHSQAGVDHLFLCS